MLRRPSSEPFEPHELAWFYHPRTWADIRRRFGRPVLDCIVRADTDPGGSGHLTWMAERKAWVLTDSGRALVGQYVQPEA